MFNEEATSGPELENAGHHTAMSLPAIALRTVSFLVTIALVGLAYPVLAALVYLGLLVASATGDQPMGGPLAGPLLVLLGGVVGAVCVAIAAPAALAVRALGGLRGVLAGAAVLVLLGGGATFLAWLVFDLPGTPHVPAALLLAAATPAAVVLSLSDALARLITRLPLRASASAAHS